MNLLEQQASNRRKTWLIMFAFVAFLLILGLGFDAFYVGAAGGYAPIGTLAALGVGSVSAVASYYNGDRAVLAATSAKPIEEVAAAASEADKLTFRRLENVVDEMATAIEAASAGSCSSSSGSSRCCWRPSWRRCWR